MPVVAVAGGTGKLGRAIVDALVSDGQNDVLVLAREVDEAKQKEIGARLVAADYSSVDGLAALLEANNVETVISTISSMAEVGAELSLIKAADKSAATKRYIPSIWGIKYTAEIASYFPMAQAKLNVLKAMESTSLKYTSVLIGFFLDYFVAPRVKSYLDPLPLILDVANNTAAIPGSGDVPVVFTHTSDVARFTVALLTLPKWEKESYVIGDKVTWNEFLGFVEEARGVKFTVAKDSIEKLRAGQITELPSHKHMYPFFPKEMLQGMFSAFGRMFEEGAFDLKPPHTLNYDFPEIQPRKVRQLVFEAWKEA